MVLNWSNTSFWLAYGVARKDPIIVIPNAIGLLFGLMQGLLCPVLAVSKEWTMNSRAIRGQ
jgi:lipid-A-disaccharide synthase-like uncharacterized protein